MRIALLFCALLLAGCSTPHTARAAVQAGQAVQGAAALITSPAVAGAVATLSPEQQAAVGKVFSDALALLHSAQVSLEPVVAVLGEGLPVPVETTPEQAAADPTGFARDAAREAGRAEAEADRVRQWREVRETVFSIGASVAGSWWSQGLLALGGVSGVVAFGVKLARDAIATRDRALHEAVRTGDELAEAETPEQVAAVKTHAVDRQLANGTHATIAAAIAKRRARTTAT